ncbi:unnamed protein product [Rotaria socialis]|uniref:Histidine-specific methyltransferase SAM-dependent domain-containing protein n=1 Tax=Rotaria socialis TaxID=392032 RepID=A0A820XQR5_9BILA|nr:unnamed protein product [Rotaria socialis]
MHHSCSRREQQIFETNAEDIAAQAQGACKNQHQVAQLGAGIADRVAILLNAIAQRQTEPLYYIPVDVSSTALDMTKTTMQSRMPGIFVIPKTVNYVTEKLELPNFIGRTLVMCIGASIDNFSREEAAMMLEKICHQLQAGDEILLGIDMFKDPAIILSGYCDTNGLHDKFHGNFLRRLNREFGYNFDVDQFRHQAIWNERESRVELVLESSCSQRVQCNHNIEKNIDFITGDKVHTPDSYKYTYEQIIKLIKDAGLELEKIWNDENKWFIRCVGARSLICHLKQNIIMQYRIAFQPTYLNIVDMPRIKRKGNHVVQHSSKKQKLKNEISIIDINESASAYRCLLEDLSNEIFYEIFDHLDNYHIYKGFFHLNRRFKKLMMNSNLPMTINISTMSKSNFENYYNDILIPNKRRINTLRSSNPFVADILFLPPRLLLEFIHLETLILDKIKMKTFDKIFVELMFLPKLHSLTISPGEYVQSSSHLFSSIFSLHKLKYCKIIIQTKVSETMFPAYLSEYDESPIEYLIIDGRFPFESLNNLLSCLPRLRHLSISTLVKSGFEERRELPSTKLKYLKYISLNLDYVRFDQFEKILKTFFHYVEILRIATLFDEAYLNAKRWEELLSIHMPCLRIFDMNHCDSIRNNSLTYHDLIDQFNSSFWISKQWFFTHQHDWQQSLESGMFYSTNRYRRQDYTFYWELADKICPHAEENNLNSVKHVHVCSKRANKSCVNYFPNATQLSIKRYFETLDDSISTSLSRIVPLQQLTKLVIECYNFPWEEIVKLLCFTPNLDALKLDFIKFNENNINLMTKSKTYQYVSNTNKIKNLDVRHACSYERMRLIINLFPKLEYLKTGVNRKEIVQIVRFLLSKSNNETQNLFFLCISEIPKICLKELNFLIKLENLLGDYFITFINRDLYLWW